MLKASSSGSRRSVRFSIALAAALVLLLALSVSAFAADLIVDDGGGSCSFGASTYTSVQTAVSAANPTGDVIKICDGTYVEPIDLSTKSISLLGETQTGTILATTSATSYGIYGTGALVSIENLTVVGSHVTYGVKLEGPSTVSLKDLTVMSSRSTNIDLNGMASATLENIVSKDAVAGNGITFKDIGITTLNGTITTSGNTWGGIAVYTQQNSFVTPITSITVNGTLALDETNQLMLEMDRNSATGYYHSIPNVTLPVGYFNFATVADRFNPISFAEVSNLVVLSSNSTRANAVAAVLNGEMRNNKVTGPMALQGTKVYLVGKANVATAIADALTWATPGGTVFVGQGQFAESLSVTGHVRLIGLGSDANPASNTVIKGGAGSLLTVNASGTSSDPLLFRDFRVAPVNQNGIYFPSASTSDEVLIDRVQVVGSGAAVGEVEFCIFAQTASTVTDMLIKDSAFNDCELGLTVSRAPTGGADCSLAPGAFDRVTIQDSSFVGNGAKGLYIEKLNDLTLSNVIVANNGNRQSAGSNPPFHAGIDINLKCTDYENLTLNNVYVLSNGLGAREGMGAGIKARDDNGGGAPPNSYADHPATLTGVVWSGGAITGNERGLRVGEPGKSNPLPAVTISGVSIQSNNRTYGPNDGSIYGDIVNWSQSNINAGGNWVGDGLVLPNFSTATGSLGTIDNVASDLPNPVESFTVSIPNATSVQPQTTGVVRVPVVLGAGYASDVASLTFRLEYPPCMTYQPSLLTNYQPQVPLAVFNNANSPAAGYFLEVQAINLLPSGPVRPYHGGKLFEFVFSVAGCAENIYSFDFLGAPTPSLGVTGGYVVAKSFSNGTIDLDLNAMPYSVVAAPIPTFATNIAVNEIRFSQNAGPLAQVATLTALDDDDATSTGFDRVFSLADPAIAGVACPDATLADRALFTVGTHGAAPGEKLLAVRNFTVAEFGSRYVCVRADDQRGGTVFQQVKITLRDKPDIIDPNSPEPILVAENAVVNTLVATLDVNDTDVDDTVIEYSIQGGTAASFITVVGDQLRTSFAPLTASLTPYTLIVRAHGQDDTADLWYEQTLLIRVVNAAELSVFIDNTASPMTVVQQNSGRRGSSTSVLIDFAYISGDAPAPSSVTFDVNYESACLSLDTASAGFVVVDSDTVKLTAASPTTGNVAWAKFFVSSNPLCPQSGIQALLYDTLLDIANPVLGGVPPEVANNVLTTDGYLHVLHYAERGDCNSIAPVDAADLTAVVLEIFDADDSGTAPRGFLETPKFYPGNPYGCDANATGHVEVSDITRVTNYIFGQTGTDGNIRPAMTAAASLALASKSASTGEMVELPLTFAANGGAINSLAFTLQFDPATTSFDATDANKDGLPDALHMNVAGFTNFATYDAQNGVLQVITFGFANPLPTISDGVVASVWVKALANGQAGVSLVDASAGDVNGNPVVVIKSIGELINALFNIFIPIVD